MAPELLSTKRVIGYDGRKVDVWALGVLVYQMLTGEFPFLGKNEVELRENVMELNYREDLLGGEESRAFLRKIFVVDPGRRPGVKELIGAGWLAG